MCIWYSTKENLWIKNYFSHMHKTLTMYVTHFRRFIVVTSPTRFHRWTCLQRSYSHGYKIIGVNHTSPYPVVEALRESFCNRFSIISLGIRDRRQKLIDCPVYLLQGEPLSPVPTGNVSDKGGKNRHLWFLETKAILRQTLVGNSVALRAGYRTCNMDELVQGCHRLLRVYRS